VAKGFREEDFANLHPGGRLGKRLMRVHQLMHAGDRAPIVPLAAPMKTLIDEMSDKALGMACVVDEDGVLAGVVTDGDLRRHMSATGGLMNRTAADLMTRHPVTIPPDTLAVEALHVMEQRKITAVVVVDAARQVQGVVHLHDLWRTQMV
jgi:arabinose-5-phosphate isomerase